MADVKQEQVGKDEWLKHTRITASGRMVTPPDVYMQRPEIQEELDRMRRSKFVKALRKRR